MCNSLYFLFLALGGISCWWAIVIVNFSLDYKLEWDLVLSDVDNIMICLVLTLMLFVALGSSHVDGHQ